MLKYLPALRCPMMVIGRFEEGGNLEPGIHRAGWDEFCARFGTNAHRRGLLGGLRRALAGLRAAGCKRVYVDGSFVTAKPRPNDYDAIWDDDGVGMDMLDETLLILGNGRMAQKKKYLGELFPLTDFETGAPSEIMEIFQTDRKTLRKKGIVEISLGEGLD